MTYHQNFCHEHQRRALGYLWEKSNTWRQNGTCIYASHFNPYIPTVNCGLPNHWLFCNVYLECSVCAGALSLVVGGQFPKERVNMSTVQPNGALSPVWVLHILTPVKNLKVHTIFLQFPFGSNPTSSQFHTCDG